ncbi:MAG: vanadium-dependent haloperoxidase [Chitinophagales bacterium]
MKKPHFALIPVALGALIVATAFYGCKNMNSTSGSNVTFNTKSKAATEFPNKMAIAWVDMLLDQVRFQRVGPPPAARAMGYLGVAMYQSVMPGISNGNSLEGQLKDLKDLPKADADKEYDWPTVLNNSSYLVCDEGLARFMGPNTQNLQNLRDNMNHMCDSVLNNKEVFDRSKKYGEDLGNAIVGYMQTDQFDYTRENNIYESPSRAGDPAHPDWYEVTDVDKTPYEPFWGTLRPLGLDTSQLCLSKPSDPYSSEDTSKFCMFCMKLYGIDTSFTEDQRITSLYWADCPVETFTPPGHWMKIAKQQVRKHNFNLAQACELYCYLGMAEYNAGLAVWKVKYSVNLVRPKTYINEIMNKPDWEPYLETPPFPEYPSGHSGFSGAAAMVLTKFFGETEFIDSTNMVIGLDPRHFKSFDAAAEEAAWSRMYGGIHYEAAIIDAKVMGNCLAKNLMDNIKLGSGTDETAMAKK